MAVWKWDHCPFGQKFSYFPNGHGCFGPHMVGLLVRAVMSARMGSLLAEGDVRDVDGDRDGIPDR